MSEIQATSASSSRWPHRWAWAWLVLIMVMVHACRAPGEPEPTPSVIGRPSPQGVEGVDSSDRAIPTRVATSSPTPELLAPTPAPDSLFALHPVAPQPAALSTPLPDAQEIVDAVLGRGDTEHWVTHLVTGSFTAPAVEERLAMVGNIGEQDEIRWVLVGRAEQDWQLRGVSEWLGSGFDAPPSFYLQPDLLDFDGDGRQEVLSHYFRMQRGWTTSADILHRWDGHSLARIWSADGVVDNTAADNRDVPQPYRQNYRAEWEWVDLTGDGVDEILLRQHVVFYPADKAQGEAVLGEEAWERTFCWDGDALRPCALDGPAGAFAYTVLGELWLWQNRAARPLGAGDVREFRWSPDGLRLAWRGPTLGVYDLAKETRQEFSLEGGEGRVLPVDCEMELRWAPDGRLVYALPGWPSALLDPETGEQELFSAASLGTWSPDGERMAYERDGGLYVCDFAAGQERSLITVSEGTGTVAPAVLPDPVWSPRGDWIAFELAAQNFTWVGLGVPDLPGPLSELGLLEMETFGGQGISGIEFAWSPDGSQLAVLATTDPAQPAVGVSEPGRVVLNLIEVPPAGDETGGIAWRPVLELEAAGQTAGPAWSPDGDRVTLAAGNEVWEVPGLRRGEAQDGAAEGSEEDVAGGATPRYRFSVPELGWTTLEWAPDGNGFLLGVAWIYDQHLYWFPADGTAPVLLLADSLGTASWSPRAEPSLVLVEYTGDDSRLHFVSSDGSETTVAVMGGGLYIPFQIGGGRVYYDYRYADRTRAVSLLIPDVPGGCRPPLVSPDGDRLAWLCDGGPPDLGAMIDGTAEIHFRLFVTDGRGRNPREVWDHIETGPDYRNVQLMSWRTDGEVIYLSRPKYGMAWAYFDYNPDVLALDVNAGEATQIGVPDGVHDGLVSPDGVWIAQSMVAEWPKVGGSIILYSLVDGTGRVVPSAKESLVAGDFLFSPDNAWLAWREWGTGPDGLKFLIRALPLPDGEPFTVYEDAERAAPGIGGWLRRDDLVLVYPLQDDGTGGYSTVVTLPGTGPGDLFSPFTFLGVLADW